LSLCGRGGLNSPQDGLRLRLLFGIAPFFGVCFGVGIAFFSTRPTWLYAEATAVWMWKHVSIAFFRYKNPMKAFQIRLIRAGNQTLLLSSYPPPLI